MVESHLVGEDILAKLFPLQRVGDGGVKTALRAADHLSTNPDTAFVEEPSSVLVPVTKLSNYGTLRDLHTVKLE